MKRLLTFLISFFLLLPCVPAAAEQDYEILPTKAKSSFKFVLDYSNFEFFYDYRFERYASIDIDDCGVGPTSAPETIGSYFSVDIDHCRIYGNSDGDIACMAAVILDYNNTIQQNVNCFTQLFSIIAALEYDTCDPDVIDAHLIQSTDPPELSAVEMLWEKTMYPAFAPMKVSIGECVLLYQGRYNYYAVMLNSDQFLCVALCDGIQFNDSAFDLHVAVLNADIAALQQAKAVAADSSEAGRVEVALLRKQLELAELLYQQSP